MQMDRLEQASQDFLGLLKEIKELAGAIGIGTDIDGNPYIQLMFKAIMEMHTDKKLTLWSHGGAVGELSTTSGGLKYLAVLNQEAFHDWLDYCWANNLCPFCSAEIVETQEDINGTIYTEMECPSNCDHPEKLDEMLGAERIKKSR